MDLNARHRKTLRAVFADPVSSSIRWRDIEAMLVALGAEVSEGSGACARFTLNGLTLRVHRPHPSPDTKRYVVREVREFLILCGIEP